MMFDDDVRLQSQLLSVSFDLQLRLCSPLSQIWTSHSGSWVTHAHDHFMIDSVLNQSLLKFHLMVGVKVVFHKSTKTKSFSKYVISRTVQAGP
jgi:hypothetical protein